MKKLEDIRVHSIEEFNRTVIEYANSDLPIENLNALMFGTKYKLKDDRFISAINKMLSSDASFFGTSITIYAQAALHVLGVKEYTGDDDFALRLIDADFQI